MYINIYKKGNQEKAIIYSTFLFSALAAIIARKKGYTVIRL